MSIATNVARRRLNGAWIGWLLTAIATLLTVSPSLAATQPVVVASKKFPESVLIGEILAQLLEARGVPVERKLRMGNTALVFENLKHGNVHIYPEYTGTAKQFVAPDATSVAKANAEKPDPNLPADIRRLVESELQTRFGLTWGPPLGFNNTYALAVRNEFAKQHGLRSVSELARLSQTTGVRFVSTHEFLARNDGWSPLSAFYNLKGAPRGVEHGIAYELLAKGEADVTEVYATEGLIAANDVTVLEDDRRFFPPYDAAFLYGQRVAGDAVVVGAILSLADRFSDARMRALNQLVEVKGQDEAEVAKQFLRSEQLVRDARAIHSGDSRVGSLTESSAPPGFWKLLTSERGKVLQRIGQHLWLTLIALATSATVGIPLGYFATRRKWLSALALGGSNIVQTIPSLALLVFMIPAATALGRTTSAWADAMEIAALLALFLYGLLPIVRNTKDGIIGVDSAVVDAARGLGMNPRQIAAHVLLPLAAPFIVAGLRTSAVIGTGSATLAAFIGAGGLGEAIISGLSVQNYGEVLTGAVPAAGLAMLFDAGFGLLQLKFKRP